ncbi:hypothetical protein QBC43DRAFT_288507 [Cladorrhinum sp. PSN259]|nr:hypothetical protein QBC43DRAFT_288507 [Cladorrhinum sp. PSN259]
MAKYHFFLSLTACLLAFLTPTFGADDVTPGMIFTVDLKGTSNGGCGGREGIVDQWIAEGSFSVDTAMAAIDKFENEGTESELVREAILMWFGIGTSGTKKGNKKSKNEDTKALVAEVKAKLDHVQDYFNFRKTGRTPKYDPKTRFLFCHSNFLERHAKTDPALDFQAKVMKDKDNKDIPIGGVQAYKDAIEKEKKAIPWWAGAGGVNGYFFTETGGDFCGPEKNLGLTAKIEKLKAAKSKGTAVLDKVVEMIIICPAAFDKSPQQNSYREANGLVSKGLGLEKVVPKSATLLHELFHGIFGDKMAAGKDEDYDISDCIKLAKKNPTKAQKNIENYVFFIAHMYHLFGEDEGDNEPVSIKKKWNFEPAEVKGKGKATTWACGAVEPA